MYVRFGLQQCCTGKPMRQYHAATLQTIGSPGLPGCLPGSCAPIDWLSCSTIRSRFCVHNETEFRVHVPDV